MNALDYNASYNQHVARLEQLMGADAGFRNAIGSDFVAVGKLEYYLLRWLGLEDGHLVVDVGCGSGRLACQLAPYAGIKYIGSDVVQRLLNYAERLCERPDWRFVHVDGISIPCADATADFVCFFSVITHLLHQDSFKYFREARRCLKPGGLMVISFLEFREPTHWEQFLASVDNAPPNLHLNQFVEREAINAWATHTGFEVVSVVSGDIHHIPIPEEILFESGARMGNFGTLGQSVAILMRNVL